jgi:hypothetical protein
MLQAVQHAPHLHVRRRKPPYARVARYEIAMQRMVIRNRRPEQRELLAEGHLCGRRKAGQPRLWVLPGILDQREGRIGDYIVYLRRTSFRYFDPCGDTTRFEESVDYHGSDLIAGGVPGGAKDAQDCCRKCIASAECSFWTWGKDNKKCWVKKTDGGYFGPEGFPTLTPRHQASCRCRCCCRWETQADRTSGTFVREKNGLPHTVSPADNVNVSSPLINIGKKKSVRNVTVAPDEFQTDNVTLAPDEFQTVAPVAPHSAPDTQKTQQKGTWTPGKPVAPGTGLGILVRCRRIHQTSCNIQHRHATCRQHAACHAATSG